jgi:hypothetical protein
MTMDRRAPRDIGLINAATLRLLIAERRFPAPQRRDRRPVREFDALALEVLVSEAERAVPPT